MALSDDDLDKIGLLFDSKLESRLDELREELKGRFDTLGTQVEGLYQRDETRQQEYLMIREQLQRHEKRIEALEKDVA